MDARARLERIWYDGAVVPLWLRALVPLYRGLRALHLAPWRLGWRRPRRLSMPVVVVGNLTVGGAGKTPLVLALVEALAARGFHPGIVSRGYGGRRRGPLRVDVHSTSAEVGDEPYLMFRRSGVPVAVGRERAAAAALLQAAGVDVVIADDGLQNPSLARDLEILVIDGQRRFGNRRLLPAGPLREPLSRLAKVDFRVCNGGQAEAGEISMRLCGEVVVSLLSGERRALDDFVGAPLHAVAGIGNPERFFAALRARGLDLIPHAFADHHVFQPGDFAFDDGGMLLMTEKDAVKCADFARPNWWQLPVRAELPEAFLDALAQRLCGVSPQNPAAGARLPAAHGQNGDPAC